MKETPAPLDLAVRCLDDPLYPSLGQRCPRCGERLPRPPGAAQVDEGQGVAGSRVPLTTATECPRCGVELRSEAAGAHIVPVRNGFVELFRGMAYIPRGYWRIIRSPRLWLYAIVPILLNIVALVLAGYLALEIVSPWLQGIQARWDAAGGFWSYAQYGLVVVDWIFTILIFPAIAILILIPPFSLIYKLIFMPIMEIMTEATERIELGFKDSGGFDPVSFLSNLAVSIVDAILITIVQVLVAIVLLPFNLIPVVGSLFWGVVMPAAFAGMDYTDILFVRRDYTVREKLRLWRTYQWRFFGYGLAFFVFLSFPLLNAFVIPAAATGGAMLYLGLERK